MQLKQSLLSPYARGGFYFGAFFGALGLYIPFLSLHFRELGLTGGQIGWTAVVTPIVMAVVSLPVSSWADKLQRRRLFLQICLAGCVILFWLGRLPTTFGGILIWYVAFASFNAPSISLANGLIARMAVRHQLTFGGMRLWGSIIFSVLSVGFGFVIEAYGLLLMFPAAAVIFAVAWLMAGLLEEPSPAQLPHADKAQPSPPFVTVILETKLWELLIPWVLMMMGFGIALVFEGIYIQELGGSESLIGLTLGVVAMCELPGMLGAERLIRRFGGATTLMVGYGLIALSMLGYGVATAAWMMPFFGALRGIGFGIALPANTVLVDRRVPVEWSASAQATTLIGMGAARTFALPAGGQLYDAAGGGMTFLVCAGVVTMGVLFLYAVKQKTRG
ncbi:MAG: MFS transporter [Ardenticatenaceae bacterium]|nr:MFS transporter [Ardenticatenaceae bacterium]